MTDLVYLEDLSVGQRFTSGTWTLDAEAIKRFAAEFDPQPFHTDEEAAKETFFGGLAASGWHTAAVTMRLLVDGGAPIGRGVIGAGGEIAWPRATRPGDTLHVESEILENPAVAFAAGPGHGDDADRDPEPVRRGGTGADLEDRRLPTRGGQGLAVAGTMPRTTGQVRPDLRRSSNTNAISESDLR